MDTCYGPFPFSHLHDLPLLGCVCLFVRSKALESGRCFVEGARGILLPDGMNKIGIVADTSSHSDLTKLCKEIIVHSVLIC